MLNNVRLIVLNHSRPINIDQIINVYESILPITVVNNNPHDEFPYLSKVEVLNNHKNYYCMERWHRCFEYDEEFKFILDDDLLPHPSLLKKMLKLNRPICGIYGKSKVETSNSYSQLQDHWCEDSLVDFLVGSVILVKQSSLDLIKKQIEKIGYPIRGDDIIVSYLIKNKLKINQLQTVSGKVMNLPDHGVGLNKDANHFKMRWNLVEKFKNNSWTANESIVK